jgi:hypothetical protein
MKMKCSNKLRTLLIRGVVVMGVAVSGCAYIDFRPEQTQSQQQPKKIIQPAWYDDNDPAQRGLNYKFRGAYSGQIVADAFGNMKDCVVMYDDKGNVFYQSGGLSLKNRSIYEQGRMRTPVTLRVIWRAANDSKCRMDNQTRIFEGGTLIGDYTVPVASRIPDELLDAVREGKGRLRLKIRVSDEGPLIGWDIEQLSPFYNEVEAKRGVYFPSVFAMAGGDFREAGVSNGKRVRQGWYINKKTGQKIETDF